MMVGGETKEAQVMPGAIRHLALAPNGNFVSMLDGLGRLAIHQIDACADVIKWQPVEDMEVEASTDTGNCAIKYTVWLTSDLLALVLTNGSVVYSKLDEEGSLSGPTSSDSENEVLSSSGPSGRLVVLPVKHQRFAVGASRDTIRTLALISSGHPSGNDGSSLSTACEFITTDSLWVVNLLRNLTLGPFIDLLMDAQQFDDALATSALFEVSGDSANDDGIHRRVWLNYCERATVTSSQEDKTGKRFHGQKAHDPVRLYTRPRGVLHRGERDDFLNELDHLREISDKNWVLNECLSLVTEDSSTNMKKILDLASDTLRCLIDGNEVTMELTQKQKQVQRYMYRLETLQTILIEESEQSTITTEELFDGSAFVIFRSSSILEIAMQFAIEGRMEALAVLCRRHGWNLFPHWLKFLELTPSSTDNDGEIRTLIELYPPYKLRRDVQTKNPAP